MDGLTNFNLTSASSSMVNRPSRLFNHRSQALRVSPVARVFSLKLFNPTPASPSLANRLGREFNHRSQAMEKSSVTRLFFSKLFKAHALRPWEPLHRLE